MKKRLGLYITFFYLGSLVGLVMGCAGATDSSSTSSITAALTSSESGTTSTTPIPMTLTFSEDVSGLTTGDFTVSNGTVSNLVATTSQIYTFDFTPTAFGAVTILLPADSVTNDNGSTNTISNSFSITYAATTSSSFQVTMVDDGNFSYYLNKNGAAFGTTCSIASTASSAEDITCTLELNEGDLWFWGLQIKNTAPASMCKYVRAENYFFYNFEMGYGPQNIDVYIDLDGTGATTFDAAKFPSVSTCARGVGAANTCCIVDGTTYQPCTGVTELSSVDQITGEVTCMYDHTPNAPNCCRGTYNYATHILATGGTAVTNSSQSNVSWGGNPGACMGGPAMSDASWPKDAITGLPFSSVIHFANSGLSDTWDLGNPSDLSGTYNIWVANYFTTAGARHSHTANGAGAATTSPWAIDPIADRNGTLLSSANPNYVFSCLDDAFEVKHRITLKIREWNTSDKFAAYATAPHTEDTDIVGVSPNCTEIDNTAACNDRYDWDDFLMNQTTGAWSTYDDATPANWGDYFPAIQ